MERNLNLAFRFVGDGFFDVEVYEPSSGEVTKFRNVPLSFDEHPEFDWTIGNEIYSWLSLWKEEEEEMEEQL